LPRTAIVVIVFDAVVAGHICLDIIPTFYGDVAIEPGKLVRAGPAMLSSGGVVSNTGRALAKLGISTRLIGKVGDDAFGSVLLELLGEHRQGMVVTPGDSTSYTVVINLSGKDRTFLHAPGCNDTFTSDDVSVGALAGARLFHFGYPTLMARMFEDEGEELVTLLKKAGRAGLKTSLDMSLPDPQSPAGRADWKSILARVLPYVDIFIPSLDELSFMLGNECEEELAQRCLDMGVSVAGVKLGSRGLYLRTPREEVSMPAKAVEVQGTTGAGDASIAGFLAGQLRGQTLETCARWAVTMGALCCEHADATSGHPTMEELLARF
jgi:sugar/nucleoside kinase (ribokinase family)